ncbi:hypothetical protein CVT26_004872 [Gymnopilus dilepis]|uniref:Nephrocystin 3-like N-terminal domain-containing protein n=1 Tax=Gymnopilus dilepis TaxID=231916 RepID=A0A409W8I6_9AGAR|nr:hypothetical protein CVT26_004872 [Gymnopilus dilepis]
MFFPHKTRLYSKASRITLTVTVSHVHSTVPEALTQAAAHSAFHNSGARSDPPRCHPNTRVAIQKKIMKWIRGLDPETKRFSVMWLYGPAGSGKSAIAQTIAEMLDELRILLASFFFARSDPSRNCSRFLVATIAYQIALCLPGEVAGRIYAAVSRNPHVFRLSLQAQIACLLVEPLQPLVETGYFNNDGSARAVVIDGLDECIDHKEQADILLSLSTSLHKHRLPICFFISGRPDLEIKDAFNSSILNSLSTRLALADDYQADRDIKYFLSEEFQQIKQTHTLGKRLPAKWPSVETMEHLLQKSSGQFIYASTAIKFVKSKRHDPDERLRIILGLQPPGKDLPFADLDALYRHLFSTVDDWEKVSLILAFCILREDTSRFTTGAIETILGFGPDSCHLLLCDLRSIIDLDNRDSRLTFFHASVQDFLLDQTRSKEFYIDPPTWHDKLIRRLLDFFQSSTPFQWEVDGMDEVDLKILRLHIELASSSQDLEEKILNFEVLRVYDHKFPPHVAYSIPDYLSIIKDSQLEWATAIYQKQEHAFHEHLVKKLRGYGERPFVNFLLLCISSDDFLGVHGPILKDGRKTLCLFPAMHDSLWVEAGWAGAGSSYVEALKVAAKEIIFKQTERQTVTSAALYALKEASVLTQERTDQKERFFLDNCNHLLEKAAWSEDLTNYARDLALPLILEHHPDDVLEIDTATHNYLSRMGIETIQDYAFLSLQALTKFSKSEEKSRGSFVTAFLYFIEKAGHSAGLVYSIQNFAMSHFLDQNSWGVELIDTASRDYLTRMGIASKQDYASLSCEALTKASELLDTAHEEEHYTNDVRGKVCSLIHSCRYLVKNASPSHEFIDFLRGFKQHRSPEPNHLNQIQVVELDILIYGYLAETDKAVDLDYISLAYSALRLFDWMSNIPRDHFTSHYWCYFTATDVVKHCTRMLERAGRSKKLVTFMLYKCPYGPLLYPSETQMVEEALEEYRKRMGADGSQPFVPSAVDTWEW